MIILSLRKLKGYKYDTKEIWTIQTDILGYNIVTDYIKLNEAGFLVVEEHYATDGPSGPTIDTPSFMRGALFHDALYQLIREGYLPLSVRIKADKLLRKVCLEDEMYSWRAWYVYHIVRLGGEKRCLPEKNPRGQIINIVRTEKGVIYGKN